MHSFFKSKIFLSVSITLFFLCLNYFISIFANHFLPVANLNVKEFPNSNSFYEYFVTTNIKNIWLRWDSNYYLEIIRDGYDKGPFTTEVYKNWAFYPLYPLIIKFIASVLFIPFKSDYIFYIGIVLSNVFIAAAVYYLLKIMDLFEIHLENKILFLFLLFLSPGAYFFHLFFTESLFILMSVLTFFFLFKKKYLLSAVFLSLALVTRVIAISVVPAFILFYLSVEYKKKDPMDMIAELFVYILIMIAPLASFFLYLYYLTGNFFAAFSIQTAWGNTGLLPLGIFYRYFNFHGVFVFWDYFWAVLAVLMLIVYVIWFSEKFYQRYRILNYRKELLAIFIYIMGYIVILSTIQNFNSIFRYISANVFIFLFPFLFFKFENNAKSALISYIFLSIFAFLHVIFLIFFVNNIPVYGF